MNCLYSVNAPLSGSFHLSIPCWVELMPSSRSLGCTRGLSYVGVLLWRSVAMQEWQHPAEDLWSLHLAGKVAPAAAQRVIPRCPLVSEMSTEPTHAAALLAGGLDDAAWSAWMMLNGSAWHHCRRASFWLCPAQLWRLWLHQPMICHRLIPRGTLPSSLWTCPVSTGPDPDPGCGLTSQHDLRPASSPPTCW